MAWPTTAAATNDVISASQWNNLPIKIQEYVLTSDTETVRFSNFPAWFSHLLLAFSARATGAAAEIRMRLNPQYLAELYDLQLLYASGSTAVSAEGLGVPYGSCGDISGSDTEEGYWTAGWVAIPNYTTTGPKVALALSNGPTGRLDLRSSHARGGTAAALDTIELYTMGNFATGSTFTLYGLP